MWICPWGSRVGFPNWYGIIIAAARKPDNVACLRFAMQDRIERYQWSYEREKAPTEAARAGSFANLEALHAAGYRWTGDELKVALPLAAQSGNPAVVAFCLEHVRAMNATVPSAAWESCMAYAIQHRSSSVMQQLFESGRLPQLTGLNHPVRLAVVARWLEGAKNWRPVLRCAGAAFVEYCRCSTGR